MICIRCQGCGDLLSISEDFAGAMGKCRKCGSFIQVPSVHRANEAPSISTRLSEPPLIPLPLLNKRQLINKCFRWAAAILIVLVVMGVVFLALPESWTRFDGKPSKTQTQNVLFGIPASTPTGALARAIIIIVGLGVSRAVFAKVSAHNNAKFEQRKNVESVVSKMQPSEKDKLRNLLESQNQSQTTEPLTSKIATKNDTINPE